MNPRPTIPPGLPPPLPPRRARAGVLDYFPALPQSELRSLRWRSLVPVLGLVGVLAALLAGEVETPGGIASPLLTGGLFVAFVCWVISAATFLELCQIFKGRPKAGWVLLALWANAPSVLGPPTAMLLATLLALLR